MKPCPEFLDQASPAALEVHQLAPGEETSQVIYPDFPAFLYDGRRMLLHTASGLQICHLDDRFRLEPLASRPPGLDGGRLAADGRHVVFRDPDADEDRFLLHRLDLHTGKVEPGIFCMERTVADTDVPVNQLKWDAVSHDATRFAGLVYLDYGKRRDGDYGLVTMDSRTDRSWVIFPQPHSLSHLRYCPAPDPPATHDLMVQMMHGSRVDENGKVERSLGPPSDRGVDIHVLRDDGTHWRDMPWGRDGEESCIGHQLWRGPEHAGVTITLQNMDNSYGWADGTRQHVVAGWPVAADPSGEHCGRTGREQSRALLSGRLENPRFCHLGTDRTGLRFALDTFPVFDGRRAGMLVYIGNAPDLRSPLHFRYLLNSGVTLNPGQGHNHAHPILSPNGQELFFNSDFSGKPAAYIVRNLPWSR